MRTQLFMRHNELEKWHYKRRRQPRISIHSHFVMCLVDGCNPSLWYSNIVSHSKGGLKTMRSEIVPRNYVLPCQLPISTLGTSRCWIVSFWKAIINLGNIFIKEQNNSVVTYGQLKMWEKKTLLIERKVILASL